VLFVHARPRCSQQLVMIVPSSMFLMIAVLVLIGLMISHLPRQGPRGELMALVCSFPRCVLAHGIAVASP
jgi:hypothetical protein